MSLRLLAKALAGLFKALYSPLIQELSAGTYCGHLVEMSSAASESACQKPVREPESLQCEGVMKPVRLPLHMGYKRKLLRCMPRPASQIPESDAAVALSINLLPPVPEGSAPAVVPLANAAASKSSRPLPGIANQPLMKTEADSIHVSAGCKASSLRVVDGLKPHPVQSTSRTAALAKKVAPVQSPIPKEIASTSATSCPPARNDLPQNHFTLEFQDSEVEQQYQIFSAVQQVRVSSCAILLCFCLLVS